MIRVTYFDSTDVTGHRQQTMSLAIFMACLLIAAQGCASTATHKPRVIEVGRRVQTFGGDVYAIDVHNAGERLFLTVYRTTQCHLIVQDAEVDEQNGRRSLRPWRQLGSAFACPERRPAPNTRVFAVARGVRIPLGKTSETSTLELPAPRVDEWARELMLGAEDRLALLVYDKPAGELAIGPILGRASAVDAAVVQCDRILAQDAISEADFTALMSTLLDLTLRGLKDPRIDQRRHALYERFEGASRMAAERQQQIEALQALLARMERAGSAARVPASVRKDIARHKLTRESQAWAKEQVAKGDSELCRVAVTSAGAAAKFALDRTPTAIALAVAILCATYGDAMQAWVIQRCSRL